MKNLIILISFSVFLWSCGSNNSSSFEKVESEKSETGAEETVDKAESVVVEADAVCLLDNLSVRATPSDKGKWVTSISLGEVVTYTGEEGIDSVSKKPFYKIKLTGGNEGWSRAEFIEVGGQVGVFIEETEIYKRPDLLTKSGKKYSEMDIIAITSTQGDWIEVKGKRGEGKYIETGWVKSGNISDKDIDVATAKFGVAALAMEDLGKRKEALKEILGNSDLASSTFFPILQEKLNEAIADDEIIINDIIEQAADTTEM